MEINEQEQILKNKESDLRIALAKIREIEEAYQYQIYELARWRETATKLQAEIGVLRVQLQEAYQSIGQLKQQNRRLWWAIGGVGVVVGMSGLIIGTKLPRN